MRLSTLICLLILPFLVSCNFFTPRETKKGSFTSEPLGRVNDSILFSEDLAVYLRSLNKQDSLERLKKLRNQWIRKQLVMEYALQTIPEDDPEITHKFEKYKTELILEIFKKRYLEKNLDTVISAEEIRKFYTKDSLSFTAAVSAIKGSFIKVPLNIPGIDKLKEDMARKKKTSKDVRSFCIRYAESFKLDEWFSLDEIFQGTPFRYKEKSLTDFSGSEIKELSDNEHLYLIAVEKIAKPGEVLPLDAVDKEIRGFILNERKTKLIEQLEEDLYNEGKKTEKVEIF